MKETVAFYNICRKLKPYMKKPMNVKFLNSP